MANKRPSCNIYHALALSLEAIWTNRRPSCNSQPMREQNVSYWPTFRETCLLPEYTPILPVSWYTVIQEAGPLHFVSSLQVRAIFDFFWLFWFFDFFLLFLLFLLFFLFLYFFDFFWFFWFFWLIKKLPIHSTSTKVNEKLTKMTWC